MSIEELKNKEGIYRILEHNGVYFTDEWTPGYGFELNEQFDDIETLREVMTEAGYSEITNEGEYKKLEMLDGELKNTITHDSGHMPWF